MAMYCGAWLTDCKDDDVLDDGAQNLAAWFCCFTRFIGLHLLQEDDEEGDGWGVVQQGLALQDGAQPLGTSTCKAQEINNSNKQINKYL